jgi:hypothetical protein
MTKAEATGNFKVPKAVTRHHVLRGRRCPRCPFCAPSGACLDTRVKSGRCGDWVFQVVRGKQFRHLWKKPHDPRTPSQLHWRGRLTAASGKYSHALTDEQVNACIAAGAKQRSRPRLGQSGPLTGQQWWVQSQCAERSEGRMQNAESAAKALQTKGIFAPTWDTRRSASVAPPGHHRRNTGRKRPEGRKSEIRSPKPERKPNTESPKAPTCPGARVSVIPSTMPWICFGLRASVFGFGEFALGGAVWMRLGGLRPRRRAGRIRAASVEADLRQRLRPLQRERGPPEEAPISSIDDDRALVGSEKRC